MSIEGYCMHCKMKKVMLDTITTKSHNGRTVTKGKCPDCGKVIVRCGKIKEED